MKTVTLSTALACTLLLASSQALACGEGMLNAGKGLPYQGYLAPRPAAVLIYATPDPSTSERDRTALYEGLRRAGHQVTLANNADDLARALHARHYDVVIAAYDALPAIDAAVPDNDRNGAALLPVVDRHALASPDLRKQFAALLANGAGIGQYLRMIAKSLPSPRS